jgi:hypothetical protein
MNAFGRKARAPGADNFQNSLQGLPDHSRATGLRLKYPIRKPPNIFLMTSNPTIPLNDPPEDTVQRAWVTLHKQKLNFFECLHPVSSANPDLWLDI